MSKRSSYPKMSAKSRTSQSLTPTWSMTPVKSQMHRQAQDIAEPNAVVLHDTAESSKQYSSNTVKPNTSLVSLTGIGPFPDH